VIALLLGLLACDETPYDASRVSTLRVVAAVADPPEVTPGDTVSLTVHTADPEQRGADVLVWPCSDIGAGCLEATPARPLVTWTDVRRDVDEVERVRFDVPSVLGDVIADTGPITFLVWVLACEPGVCPIIDAVAAGPEAGSQAWNDVVVQLGSPEAWLVDLPMERTSLAARRVTLSERAVDARNVNPSVTGMSPDLSAVVGETLNLTFTTDSGVQARFVSTSGGFGGSSLPISLGTLSVRWLAPQVPGNVDMWVVIDDGIGGSAVWRGEVDVRAN
jgi:hypothetical protein